MSCRGWSSDAWAAVSLTLGLQESGHSVVLVCRRNQGERVAERAAEAGVRAIEFLSFESGFRPWAWREDLRGLRDLWRKGEVQVFHAHRGQDHWLAAAALRLCRKEPLRPALVRSRHILEPVRTHLANRWLYNRATDLTVAAAEKIRRGFFKTRAFRRARIVALPGGVDARRFHPGLNGKELRAQLGLPDSDVSFGMASSFIPVKGHMTALEALAVLRGRGLSAHLLLAGSGGDQDKVARRSAELGVEGAVHFLGYRRDLPAALSAADVGLFAARQSEGTSRVVLEWMALGKPVVATDVGCVRDLLSSGEEGWIVPPDDPRALAGAMERLARAPGLRRRMGKAARDRAEREYDRRVWTERMTALYRGALDRRKPPAAARREGSAETAPSRREGGP